MTTKRTPRDDPTNDNPVRDWEDGAAITLREQIAVVAWAYQNEPEDDPTSKQRALALQQAKRTLARVAALEGALELIANGNEPPSHCHYISKGRMSQIARDALANK